MSHLTTGRLSLDDCRWVFGETLFGQSLSAALEQEGNEDGNLGRDMHVYAKPPASCCVLLN